MLIPLTRLHLTINSGILLQDKDFHKFHGWVCPLKRVKIKLEGKYEIKSVINYESFFNENINNNLEKYIEIFYEYFDKDIDHYTINNGVDIFSIDLSEEELFYLRLTEMFPHLEGIF